MKDSALINFWCVGLNVKVREFTQTSAVNLILFLIKPMLPNLF